MSKLKRILPAALVIAGLTIFIVLNNSRPAPEKVPVVEQSLLVETRRVSTKSAQVLIPTQGTVIPSRRIELHPEVTGRVIRTNPNLVPGGRVKKGETIVEIDNRDYQIALSQQRASRGKASLALKLEQGRKNVAEKEWALLKTQETDSTKHPLALRKPQLEAAQLALRAAESAVQRARLNLDRTSLKAPFDGIVLTKRVDIGQLVSPQSTLGTFAATNRFWVQVSVPIEQLHWLQIPRQAGETGSKALIYQNRNKAQEKRQGHIIQLLADVDPMGKMARVLIQITDPFDLNSSVPADNARLPLLLGSYVEVDLRGPILDQIIPIPRTALYETNKLLIVGENDRLVIRQVNIAWRDRSTLYIDKGLLEGDELITSYVPNPLSGTIIKRIAPESQAPLKLPQAAAIPTKEKL